MSELCPLCCVKELIRVEVLTHFTCGVDRLELTSQSRGVVRVLR